MKYIVSFQYLPKGADRPIHHPSESDFQTDEKGFGMIPAVGDYAQIIRLGSKDFPAYDGRVRSRLFQYFGKDRCGINIVVEEDDGEGWGKVIKE